MHARLPSPVFLLLALAAAVPADAASRSFTVTGFDRIRVDGPFKVSVTTGVAPFASASAASSGALDGVSIDVQGRTLVVRPGGSSWGGYPGKGRGPIEIKVGTHELGSAWLNGPGSLAIDRVRGLGFDLSVQGSGNAGIAKVEVDQLKLVLSGTASATVAGKAPKLTAIVRGVSNLDATGLAVKDASIGAEGPATVRATVSNSAKINASGTASVEVGGGAACTVSQAGSATIVGCD